MSGEVIPIERWRARREMEARRAIYGGYAEKAERHSREASERLHRLLNRDDDPTPPRAA
jgi:hypothetical protein